jgi:hypothetical protein
MILERARRKPFGTIKAASAHAGDLPTRMRAEKSVEIG